MGSWPGAQRGRWLSYSVGMVITEAIHSHVFKIPVLAWTPASGEVREGEPWSPNWPADILQGWPRASG